MSNEMIESVAKAIAKVQYPENTFEELYKLHGKLFSEAKAVIQAMREPTEEMCLEASKLGICRGFHLGIDGPKNCWQSMIDVALKED